MRRRLPYIALWASLLFSATAMAVTGKSCFDQLLAFHRGAAEATGSFSVMSPTWVIMTADQALVRLWWLGASATIGLLLIAVSTTWVCSSGWASGPRSGSDVQTK